MTEKRFNMIITGVDGSFYYLDKITGEKITSTLELENKLNALHEENQQLQWKLQKANETIDGLTKLSDEEKEEVCKYLRCLND